MSGSPIKFNKSRNPNDLRKAKGPVFSVKMFIATSATRNAPPLLH